MAQHQDMSRSGLRKARGAASAPSTLLAAALLTCLLHFTCGPALFPRDHAGGSGAGKQQGVPEDALAFVLARPLAAGLRGGQRAEARQRAAVVRGAGREDSAAWVLPTVDKDVDEFHKGRAGAYAWVQTTETLYIFAPMPSEKKEPEGPPQVKLSVQNEGWDINFIVEGTPVMEGRLAAAVKPGTEIWMIEEAGDGRSFVVAEFDKLLPGLEWTSVLQPKVSFASDYSKPKIEMPRMTADQQASTVEATLGHLQKQQGHLKAVLDGHLAVPGNVLTVDIQGFELTPEGTRGEPLELGGAKDMEFELGSREGGLLPEIHKQLIGTTEGETRDIQVTLGQRGGGRRIMCVVSCKSIKEQVVPELNDEFARTVKQQEQFAQAGTEQGIPEEEEEAAKTFTIDLLRKEIAEEVRIQAEKEEQSRIKGELEASLVAAAEVSCEWGDLSSAGRDGEKLLKEEKFAAIVESVAQREGLLQLIDDDTVNRQTWHVLGTPKDGKNIAEVGDDPAREFQAAKRKVMRRHQLEKVLQWLEERMEISEPVE